MSHIRTRRAHRFVMTVGALVAAGALVAGCASNDPDEEESGDSGTTGAVSNNDDPGETVTIGFSGPEADHGWLAAINDSAEAEAAEYEDIELRQAEGTNDPSQQIAHVET
ncbi:MAG: sugar ABC transporter substrate-binding protein, partial [Nocardioidaceae bacterium]